MQTQSIDAINKKKKVKHIHTRTKTGRQQSRLRERTLRDRNGKIICQMMIIEMIK